MPTPRGANWRKPPIPNTFWRGPVGAATLWARLEIQGKPIRWSLRLRHPLRAGDVDIARARIEARRAELIAAVHYGDARKHYVDVQLSWADHVVREVSPTTATRYVSSLRQLKPYLDCYIDHIDRAKMREIVAGRRAANPKLTNATLRRDLTALSRVIDYAIAEGFLASDHNVALAALKRLTERRDPIVLPEPAHIARVIAAAPPSLAPLIAAALKTGCRLSELVTAERSRLDHPRRQLTVKGKGNKLRVIDLVTPAGDAYEALARAPARLGCKWLFWHHDGEPYRAASHGFAQLVDTVLTTARREAAAAAQNAASAANREVRPSEPDFRPFRFHDLRHRFAVDYLKAGGSIYTLQQHLGHTSVQTTEIYLKYLTPDEERRVKQGTAERAADATHKWGA